jgi:hypothetical protein
MRNKELEKLDVLVGSWTLTMSDAWFLEPPGTEVRGSAIVEWLGDAFLIVRPELGGELNLAIGRSDARDSYIVLYHDERGVCRVFAMTLRRQGLDAHTRGPGLPPALHRLHRAGSDHRPLGGIRGRGPHLEEGLRPPFRANARRGMTRDATLAAPVGRPVSDDAGRGPAPRTSRPLETRPGRCAGGRLRGREDHGAACCRVRHQPRHRVGTPASGRGPATSSRSRPTAGRRSRLPVQGRLVVGQACREVRRQRRHCAQGAPTGRCSPRAAAWRATGEGTNRISILVVFSPLVPRH